MTTEDYRMDLAQEREDTKRAARQELEEMGRKAAHRQDIEAAKEDVVTAASHLRQAELAGAWDDPTWWNAMARFRDIVDRLHSLEAL